MNFKGVISFVKLSQLDNVTNIDIKMLFALKNQNVLYSNIPYLISIMQ